MNHDDSLSKISTTSQDPFCGYIPPPSMGAPEPRYAAHLYRVQVGHAIVHVREDTPEAAIRAARRQLAAEYPRMWDVIQGMESGRFQVDLRH